MSNHNDRVPEELLKPDTSKNTSGLELVMERHHEYEKTLHPLRVTPTMVIYVPKDKCTEEYKMQWLIKHGYIKGEGSCTKKGSICKGAAMSKPKVHLDTRIIQKRLDNGDTVAQIAAEVGLNKYYLHTRLVGEGVIIPDLPTVVRRLKEKGLSIEEVAERSGFKVSRVKRYYV